MNRISTPDTEKPEPGNGRVRTLTVEVIGNESGFLALRPAWDELVEKSSGDIFQTFDWLSLWWKHYGADPARTLHIVVMRHAGDLVALCPLFSEVEKCWGLTLRKRLRMMGCGVSGGGAPALLSAFGPSDYLDIISDPAYQEEVVRTLFEYLQAQRERYDEMEFVNVPERSILSSHLVPEIRRRGIPHRTQRTDTCPRMQIPATADDFIRKLKPEIRRRINQVQRAARELYSLKPVQTPAELNSALQNLINLHQHRWNQLGYPGLFADRRFKLFQEEVLRSLFEQDRLWCKTVEMDGTCVAVRIGFRFNATMYDFLSGFDYDSPASKRRPGIALLFSMIQDGISSGLHALDFLRGDEEYKFDFTDDAAHNSLIIIEGAGQPGRAHSVLAGAIRPMKLAREIIRKEWVLLTVQFRVNGWMRCLPSYMRFRTERAKNKFTRASSAGQNGQGRP